jgi:hypothetical protein
MLLTYEVKTVTCATLTSRKFTRFDKHYRAYSSEHPVPPLDTAVQRDAALDGTSSSTAMSADNDNLFVSQEQHLVSDVNSVTASRNQESPSAVKHSDFGTTSPYFFRMIAALSHAFTRQLRQSTASDQKSIKEETPAKTPSITKEKGEADEKHSKFESGSQKESRKAVTLPPAHPETTEANSSFQYVKWPSNDSGNISFSNSSAPTNATDMYERSDMPALYEENSNGRHEALLSSKRLISNFTSNKSSFVDYSSDHTQVNELPNEPSDVEGLIRVINSRDSVENKWSPRVEHSPNLNVGSEKNDGVITIVNTNDFDINITASSNTRGDVMSLALAASEREEKLNSVASLINTNGTGTEKPNSFVETVNEMHLDNDNNGSITKEIFGVVKYTQLVELNDSAVYSEDRGRECGNQSVVAAESGVDDTGGVVESGSGVTVLNVEVEDAIECELASSEINGSWVDTGGGNNAGNARRTEVGKGIDFVSGTNIDSDIMSNNLHRDLGYNGTLKVSVRDSVKVGSDRHDGDTGGSLAAVGHGVALSGPSVVKQEGVMSSRTQGEKFDRLRVLKTRDTEIPRSYSNNVNELVMKNDENKSGFAESFNLNKTNYRNTQKRGFANNNTKDVENMSLDASVLHPETVDSSDTMQPSGKNITHRPHRGSVGGDNDTSVAYSENTKFDLTEKAFQEVSALTSKPFANRVNDEGTSYLHSRSEKDKFNADALSVSADSQNYTTNHDVQQNATVSVGDKNTLQITGSYNSSEILYGFAPINANSGVTAEFNFEENSTSYSYNFKFSTPDYYDKDEGIWSSLTPVLSTPESLVSGTASNGTRTSVSAISRNGSASDDEPGWPVKLSAEVAGDLILGGLMMVHEREDNTTCGRIMPQGGIQALETMLYTLDVLNRDPKMIPNVTIGAHILDDCDKDTYGLEMAVDFIKGRGNRLFHGCISLSVALFL